MKGRRRRLRRTPTVQEIYAINQSKKSLSGILRGPRNIFHKSVRLWPLQESLEKRPEVFGSETEESTATERGKVEESVIKGGQARGRKRYR